MNRRWISALLAVALVLSLISGIPVRITAAGTTSTVQTMSVSDEMIGVLKKMEGFHGVAYWDYGQWTIGYGTRCPAGKEKYYTEENPMTVEEAVALLHTELAEFENAVNKFAKKYSLHFSQNQFDALVSFSYNCGGSWMSSATNNIVKAILNGSKPSEFIYAMCLWSRAGTDYILQKRRLSEANMYLNGVYKAYNTTGGVPANYRYVFLDGNGADLNYVIHGFDANQNTVPLTAFNSIPVGKDENGVPFVYTFAGWFTAPAGGTQVMNLDSSVASGSILYAQWKDPAGNIAEVPVGNQINPIQVTVGSAGVQARSGYGTYYSKLEKLAAGTMVTVTATYSNTTLNWGLCEYGWINLANTNYADVLASLPSEEEFPEEGLVGTVTTNSVNLRSGPGTSFDIVGKANKGDAVTIYEKVYDGKTYHWGRLNPEGTQWICLDYVQYDADVEPTVVAVEMLQLPYDLEYVQMQDSLNLTGSVVKLTYSDGSIFARTPQESKVSGYSNANLGTNTVKVTYEGVSTTFDVEIVKATVTFLNYDGTVLSTQQYAYGETVAEPEEPTKPNDENGKYTFVGWDREVNTCHGDAVYTAVFQPTHVITFLNYDGTVLSATEYGLGETVVPPEAPVKPADESGEYVFVGWDQEVTVCQGNTTYTAVFQIKKHSVVFQNYDGSVLSRGEYALGEEVTPPENPTRAEDEKGEYIFVGWDKEVTACQGNTVYTAVYQLKKYTVIFQYSDGTVISTGEYYKGDTVTVPTGVSKPGDETGESGFVGWDKEVTACQGDTVYTAVFQTKKYTVTFLNYDGSVLSTGEYCEGDRVTLPEDPQKPGDETGEYQFVGWDQEVTVCRGDAVYTAVYQTLYTIVFEDYNGTILKVDKYLLGDAVVIPEDPNRPADEEGEYRFMGWDKEVTDCQGHEVYTAVYQSVYTVVFQNYDGTVIATGKYLMGDTVTVPQNPVKPGDEKGSYEFAGWDKKITACAGNAVYTAAYRLIGDYDGNDAVNEDDASYLLGYILFPEWYPARGIKDLDGSGVVNEDDASYLLGYVLFPEWYPLPEA